MGTQRFTSEFKEEAVRLITERGYSVADVSEQLGVSAHSLYTWLHSVKPDNSGHHAGFTGCQYGDPQAESAT